VTQLGSLGPLGVPSQQSTLFDGYIGGVVVVECFVVFTTIKVLEVITKLNIEAFGDYIRSLIQLCHHCTQSVLVSHVFMNITKKLADLGTISFSFRDNPLACTT
jgi:hypothetical protein